MHELIEKYITSYAVVMEGEQVGSEVYEVMKSIGLDHPLYTEWLTRTGGGPIGADWFDSPGDLIKSNEKMKEEDWDVSGVCIGWDGMGNPIVVASDGKLIVPDHDFGGVHVYAESFEDCLRKGVN